MRYQNGKAYNKLDNDLLLKWIDNPETETEAAYNAFLLLFKEYYRNIYFDNIKIGEEMFLDFAEILGLEDFEL